MESLLQLWNKTASLWNISSQDELMQLGTYYLVEHSSARDKLIAERIKLIEKKLVQLDKNSALYRKELQKRFLTFTEFESFKSRKSENFPHSKSNQNQSQNSSFASDYWNILLQSKNLLPPFTEDDELDYQKLLFTALPSLKTLFFSPKPVPIPISALNRHALLTGRTGSGKTEFMKAIFYQLMYRSHQKQQHALILLDPHGDLCEEILAFRLNLQKSERVWYIDPQFEKGKIPCINPFWQRVADPMMIDLLSQQWAKTFSELIPETGMSLQMETLLKPCLAVLFAKGNCGLSDLQLFMDDNRNEKWVELGKKSKFPTYRHFFETAFLSKKYAPTKLAIYTRLQHLQNNYIFYHMMNGASNFDLKKGMQEGKVILFNLSKGKLGEDTSKALGRFISATLLSIALQRAFEKESSRKPCYLFIDEAQNFVSSSFETFFSESRKYKLHLIVGTQSVGQLPLSLKDMVLNNTAVKLAGINGLPALKAQAGDLGVSYAAMQKLLPFEFWLKHDNFPAIKIKSPNFLLKNKKKYFMDKAQLKSFKNFILTQTDLYRDQDVRTENQVAKIENETKNNVSKNEILNPNLEDATNDFSENEFKENETISQNPTESSGSLKPKFHL